MYLQRQSKQILMLVISGIPRALHAIGHFLRKEINGSASAVGIKMQIDGGSIEGKSKFAKFPQTGRYLTDQNFSSAAVYSTKLIVVCGICILIRFGTCYGKNWISRQRRSTFEQLITNYYVSQGYSQIPNILSSLQLSDAWNRTGVAVKASLREECKIRMLLRRGETSLSGERISRCTPRHAARNNLRICMHTGSAWWVRTRSFTEKITSTPRESL